MFYTTMLFLVDLRDFSKCFSNMTSNIDNIEVNINNSISLYDLVNYINKMYQSFKKEYVAIEKISLGDKMETVRFNSFKKYTDTNNKQRRSLCYDIQGDNSWQLYIVECDNTINTYKVPVDNKDDYLNANINLELAKKHLDLFEKYEVLTNLFYYLRSRTLYHDNDYVSSNKSHPVKRHLSIKFDDGNGTILDDIEKIRIYMWRAKKMPLAVIQDIDITVKLGEELDIIEDECDIGYYPHDKISCLEALKRLFVNRKLLDLDKNIEIEQTKVRMLK